MRFSSKPVAEHQEVPLADEGRWEDVVAHYRSRQNPAKARSVDGNACYVVSVCLRGESVNPKNKLAEISALVQAQGDRIMGAESLHVNRIDPRTYLGRGSCAEVAERALKNGADMLVLDAELSPSEMRNLEDALGLAVCDREAVILNVFLLHATTRRARIQVEVAHLEYLRPRIRGLGLEMDQQAGGLMNARGPGETASELLARRLDGRLADLRKALSKLSTAATVQRRRRDRCTRIALVGYTNAGKTSLMNGLADAGLSARDMPFETLDTTSRCISRHGGDVVLSDTVGFIRRLPKRLLASFDSTLSEITDASLLAIVVDISDEEWPLHLSTTNQVLERLSAQNIPRFYVLNKTDRAPAPDIAQLDGHPHMALSSHDAAAVKQLKQRLIAAARSGQPFDEAQDTQLRRAVEGQIDKESDAFFASGRLWDDGVIDPRDSRTVLGLCLSAVHSGEIRGSDTFGVFRM